MITGNTHFAIATHVLVALAAANRLLTSAQLAATVGTNPAFLRAVLGRLRAADLIITRLGPSGGALIGRPAGSISLLDVYRATEGQAELSKHDCSGIECPIAKGIPRVLARIEQRLDASVAEELSGFSIADIVSEVLPS